MNDRAGPSDDAGAWFGHFRTACGAIAAAASDLSPADRRREVGPGAGGDTTVHIDDVAERILIAELESVARGMHLISEEVGEAPIGAGGPPWVIVDPIDGSLNAKRGLPWFATSIAVADGPTMADVTLGFVHDYATGEEFVAERGRGAWLNGLPLSAGPSGEDLRIVLVEGAYPRRLGAAAAQLGQVRRLRMLGSLALSLCQLAAGRCDGMAGLARARSVDVAAAQLVAREAGAHVGFPEESDAAGIGLGVANRFPIVGATNPAHLAQLRGAVSAARAT